MEGTNTGDNPYPNPGLGLGLGLRKKSAADFFRRKKLADFVRRGRSPPCSFGRLFPWRTKSASWQTKSANWRTQAESFASRHFSGLFLADRPPVDGGSDWIRSDPRRTQADSADFFWVRLSPPESASADALADWLADPIGSAADLVRRL